MDISHTRNECDISICTVAWVCAPFSNHLSTLIRGKQHGSLGQSSSSTGQSSSPRQPGALQQPPPGSPGQSSSPWQLRENQPPPATPGRAAAHRQPRAEQQPSAAAPGSATPEMWHTQDPCFRLHCTIQGIVATDSWKNIKYHVHSKHRLKTISINDYADALANILIHNNLNNGPGPNTLNLVSMPSRLNYGDPRHWCQARVIL